MDVLKNTAKLEEKLGYTFKDKSHLITALTHKSFVNEKMCKKRESYERYEFLGDAILEYLVSRFLFDTYKDKTEGELTKLRASLVCEYTLSRISKELGYSEYVFLGKGEYNTGGAGRSSILCDMFESVLGAIYLDGGIEPAAAYVESFLLNDIEHKALFHDSKSRLQEYAQKKGMSVEYKLLAESGPEHSKEFSVALFIGGQQVARGEGHSHKSAEQMAAFNALSELKTNRSNNSLL